MKESDLLRVLEGLPAGVVVGNAEGGIDYVNAAARELLGETLLKLPVPPVSEMEIEGQDGVRRTIQITGTRIGALPVAVLHDISAAFARAREDAEDASRAKTVFLGSMSHELRTPLNHVIGYTEMLTELLEERGLNEGLADLERVREAGLHLQAVISDVLDLANIETGNVALQIADFPLAPLLEEAAAAVRPLGERNGNRILVAAAEGLGSLRSDRAKIRQALVNGMSNATRYTEKGTVTLSATRGFEGGREKREKREMVTIVVRDTGRGMAPEKLAHLFDGFRQRDASAMRNQGGTGLGLAITKRYCEVMGGELVVESAPGEGTALTLRLPVDLG